jgi:hypothetical protein
MLPGAAGTGSGKIESMPADGHARFSLQVLDEVPDSAIADRDKGVAFPAMEEVNMGIHLPGIVALHAALLTGEAEGLDKIVVFQKPQTAVNGG